MSAAAARLIFTVCASLFFLTLRYVPLPGLHLLGDYSVLQSPSFPREPLLAVGNLGVGPLVSAFLCVELLSLLFPAGRRWRHLPEGRRRLTILSLLLSLGIALAQGALLAQAFRAYAPSEGMTLIAAGLLFGFLLSLLLAFGIERRGLGGGAPTLLVVELSWSVFTELFRDTPHLYGSLPIPERLPSLLVFSGVGVALFLYPEQMRRALSLRWLRSLEARSRETTSSARISPWLLSGLIPASWTIGAFILPTKLQPLLDPDSEWISRLEWLAEHVWWTLPLNLIFTWLLSHAFYTQAKLRRLARELDLPSTDGEEERSLILRERLRGLVFHGALAVIYFSLWAEGWALDLFTPLLCIAYLVDLRAEYQFRSEHEHASSAWSTASVYRAALLREALERARIPVLCRSLRHRSVQHFFAPHVPVEILVPEAQIERARALLRVTRTK